MTLRDLGDDEITLFDFMVETIGRMEEADKQQLARVALLLLACEEDGELSMPRVASLMELLTGEGVD